MKRKEVYQLIDGEREYQEEAWPAHDGHVSAPPSDELRLIRLMLNDADVAWHGTRGNVTDGQRVNISDLETVRKVAAVAVRCMERWGAPARQKRPN